MILSKENSEIINTTCKSHSVEKMYMFGSAASGTIKKNSDVDILVKFNKMDLYYYFDNLLSLIEKLELIFKRPVDLLEEQAVNNPFLKRSIDKNKILIYG
ncbi:MAG: nucleotidyltransferase domain-containing protein [Draconibacterium sp.]|nr:nucleotidyltransferase domain-containing protein [Draconibacterium sp.]